MFFYSDTLFGTVSVHLVIVGIVQYGGYSAHDFPFPVSQEHFTGCIFKRSVF